METRIYNTMIQCDLRSETREALTELALAQYAIEDLENRIQSAIDMLNKPGDLVHKRIDIAVAIATLEGAEGGD